eukprot:SAG31_NODE_43027_length_269_cov_0.594118_2_plen_59_part_01
MPTRGCVAVSQPIFRQAREIFVFVKLLCCLHAGLPKEAKGICHKFLDNLLITPLKEIMK